MTADKTLPLLLLALTIACSDEPDRAFTTLGEAGEETGQAETPEESSDDESDDGEDCTPGTDGCACAEGLCGTGLTCYGSGDGICIPDTGDGDGGDGDGDGDPTGDGDGDTGCVLNADCWYDEVCVDNTCEWALFQNYSVEVYFYDGYSNCWDEGLESGCFADIYMVAHFGGIQVANTPYYPDTEEVWFDPFSIFPDGSQQLDLRFWDYDEFSADDQMKAYCSGQGECGPLTAFDLHTGFITWTSADGSFADAYFSLE